MTIGEPTDTDVIFVGTHRPTLKNAKGFMLDKCERGAESKCLAGHWVDMSDIKAWGNYPSLHDCWSAGCYDVPVYASLAEVIAAGWKPKEAE